MKLRFGPDLENREPEPEWQIPPIETRPRQPFFTIRSKPMSYSFGITAATKDEAGEKVEAELTKVVVAQPSHDTDRQAIQDAAEAFINMLTEPGEGECIRVDVYGSLSWRGEGVFTSANVNVSAYITAKA